MGFSFHSEDKGARPQWHFRRPRATNEGGGFDALDLSFSGADEKSVNFIGIINVISSKTIESLKGVFQEEELTACVLGDRIAIARDPELRGILSILFWRCRMTGFGFYPRRDVGTFGPEAERACEEFLKCLPQAERWWTKQILGPNLEVKRVGGQRGPTFFTETAS